METWNSWSHQKDYVYGPQGLLATVTRSGELMFYHQDHLGTPRAITNVNGVLRGRYDYFPFGQEIPRDNPLDDWNVKFTGHQRDPHGLADYMMARTCLWPLRRFASVDPGRRCHRGSGCRYACRGHCSGRWAPGQGGEFCQEDLWKG